MSLELLLFALLGLGAWHWWDGLQKRELALQAAQQACARAGVQLLDASVALRRLRLARDENQRVRVNREYAFDYSATGDDRQVGRIYLQGMRVVGVSLIHSVDNVQPLR